MNRVKSFLHKQTRALRPWRLQQLRGAKILGADVREGNVIKRTGRNMEVVKTQHTQQGRGGATIQVELRDIQTGLKSSERFRTTEALEKVFVESKRFTFLYMDGDTVFLMEPQTFEQVEVAKSMFGYGAAYLKDGMSVTVQYADGEPLSASVPQRVTCKVVDAEPSYKGQTATPMSHHAGSTSSTNQTGSIPSLSRSGIKGPEDEATLAELRELKRQMDELDKKYDSYFTVEYALELARRGFKDSDEDDEPSANTESSDSTDPLIVTADDLSEISDNDVDNASDAVSSDVDKGVSSRTNSINDDDDDDYDD